jgi:two-component system response regulator AtoC
MSPLPMEEVAAEAVRRGAYDCLTKPPRPPEVVLTLRRAREHARLRRTNQVLQRDVTRALGDHPIVAASKPMIELLEMLERAATFDSTVLITGDRGTGKEGIARTIHAQSTRRQAPFVAVNCGATPASDLERDLFGHDGEGCERSQARRGLFAAANGGTLFLDEVGDLAPSIHLELLRALREEMIRPLGGESKPQRFDVRVIAASTRDLETGEPQTRLDPDLLDCLSTIRIHVPPLSERREDIPLLVDHFLRHFRSALGKPVRRIADDALAKLVGHAWPGNVRELQNVIERAIIVADDDRITLHALPARLTSADAHPGATDLSLRRARRLAEAEAIRRALRVTGGNRTHAAKHLEISHRALLYKLKEYGIRD